MPNSSSTSALPNPHYHAALHPLTGRDAPVIAFLDAEPDVIRMRNDIAGFVETWLPCYVRDNRNYLTVGIGCTEVSTARSILPNGWRVISRTKRGCWFATAGLRPHLPALDELAAFVSPGRLAA